MGIADVKQFLTSHGIVFREYNHPAVFSIDEAEKHCKDIPGVEIKNLFLKDKKTGKFSLFVLPGMKKLDFKRVGAILDSRKVTFGSSEELKEKLGLEPGSVSIFGVLNDKNNEVDIYLDKEIDEADIVNFHPNINTATLGISKEMFHKFLELVESKIQVVEL